ncbi:hypothetical protein KKG66_03350 [bacterium]|nr:hypothetical protein [bacterium]
MRHTFWIFVALPCLLTIQAIAAEKVDAEFRLTNIKAEHVTVAGSFNGWDANANALQLYDDVWQTTIPLDAGYYYYKFVVDGNWIPDPNNPERVNDGGDSFNSILKVGEPPVPQRIRASEPLPRKNLPHPLLTSNPEWVELYWFAWEVLWSKVHEGTKANGFVKHYLDEGFNEQIYQWDTCFMALFAMYGRDVFPAMESLDNFYLKQRADGYIQRVYHETTGEEVAEPTPDEPLVNPPLFAWVEWLNVQRTGDPSRVRRILPTLVRYYEWLQNNCRAEEGHGLYYNTPLGSGMDNTPRGELGKGGWIDMSCQQALAAQCISRLAAIIHDSALVERFDNEARSLSALIDSLCWDEERQGYFDYLPSREPGPARHLGSYWTLQVIDNKERLNSMIQHLLNPQYFARPHMLPTLSAADPQYDPFGHYWKGGVWAPTNYMTVSGLERLGDHDTAYEIAVNHLNNLSQVFTDFLPDEDSIAFEERYADGYKTLWECYSPERAAPATRWDNTFFSRQDFVGWTGLGPIAMLLETVIGIDANALDNKIVWHIRRNDLHGVEKYLFGEQQIDLLYNPLRTPPQLLVTCEEQFKLIIEHNGKTITFDIPYSGTHSFDLPAGE